MYTNGLLVTQDKLKTLRDNGLDEIRFDLSADHYRLDALKMAIGIIPRVTVEIPAIPGDLEQTKQLIEQLHGLGVDHLNLHQIRCTSFNRNQLAKRGYTFLHGPGVTVLETELTALELIRYSLEKNPSAHQLLFLHLSQSVSTSGRRQKKCPSDKSGSRRRHPHRPYPHHECQWQQTSDGPSP